jgi:hypothetical protein
MRVLAPKPIAFGLLFLGWVGACRVGAFDQGDRLEGPGGLRAAKISEVVFDATMQTLGRVTKGHKLVGAVLREMPPDTKAPFVAAVLDKLKKLKDVGQPTQTAVEAHNIIEKLGAREGYQPRARGFLGGTKDELAESVEKLKAVHTDRSWRDRLRPRTIGPEDIGRAEADLANPLRQSVSSLLEEWKRREASLGTYDDRIRVINGYYHELYQFEQILSSIKVTHQIIYYEQLDLLQVVLPALNGARSEFERLAREEREEFSAIKREYALRSKIIDLLDLKTGNDRKTREFEAQLKTQEEALQDLRSSLADREADVRSLHTGIELEEQAGSRFEAAANRPFTDCPNHAPLNECTHTTIVNNYFKSRKENLALARRAAENVEALRPRLNDAQATIARHQSSEAAASNRIAATRDAQATETQRYTEEMTRVWNEARGKYDSETEESLRRQRELEWDSLSRTDPDSLILKEEIARVLRRLSEVPTNPSGDPRSDNPFRSSGSSQAAGSPSTIGPNPFAPAAKRPSPDDLGPGPNPFRR